MSFQVSDYTARIRQSIDDTATSHRVVENLTNLVIGGSGSRKSFPLSKQNLVAGVSADVNKAGFLTTGFTVDLVNGILTFTTAPPLSTSVPTSLDCLYYYQEFTDADIVPFIDYGLNKIGVNASGIDTGYQDVNSPNFNVVCLYAASNAFLALSARYAKYVDTSAEGKSSGKSKISDAYLKQSQEFEQKATQERLDVQGFRQGRSTVANLTTKPFVSRFSHWGPKR